MASILLYLEVQLGNSAELQMARSGPATPNLPSPEMPGWRHGSGAQGSAARGAGTGGERVRIA